MAAQNNESVIESAADYIRRGIATDAEHAQGEAGETARQIRLFREWAVQKSRLIPSDFFHALQLVSDRTSEHAVYFDRSQNRALKRTLPGQFGWKPKLEGTRWTLAIALPSDYLQRWSLFNLVFGDNAQLEGAIEGGPSMVIGQKSSKLSAVVSQPWHRAADLVNPAPSSQEVQAFLRKLGFESLANSFHGWRRSKDGIVLLDARPDNFIKTEAGIVPIDLPMIQTI